MSAHPTVRPAPQAGHPIEARRATRTAGSRLTTAAVWRELGRQSFGILAHVNAAGEPRSSGVMYVLAAHRLYIAVAPDSWKARELTTGARVSMTVPVRRGGVLSLLAPIPPATISFHATVTVHAAGSGSVSPLPPELSRLLPEEGRSSAWIVELAPEGRFLTYGIGVSLSAMRDPVAARGHAPVGS